jgi:hypothetical protein
MSFNLSVDVLSGSFASTGQAVTLQKALRFDASHALFFVTGQSITEDITEFTPAGVFAYSGQDASFSIAMNTQLDAGVFATTGNVIPFKKAMNVDLASGSFAQTGNTVLLRIGNRMPADSGAFSLSVFNVTITKVMTVSVSSLALTYTGNDIKIQGWLSFADPSETWTETSGSSDTWSEQVVQSEAA